MKVEVKKVGPVQRELKFEIPKNRVSVKLDEVYAELGKVAKIKGFRPGKVPRHVLEKEHGRTAQEETIKKLIPEVYQEGIEQEKISPLDIPEINDVQYKDGVITFTAKLDIKPEIQVKHYKGIKVRRKSFEVSEEDINKTLDFFKKGQGQDQEVTVDDAFARGLGYPSLDEFKKTLRRQLEVDKDRQNRVDVENQVIGHLLKNTKVEAPPSLVKRQLDHRIAEARQRLKSQGTSDDDIKKREEQMQKELREAVEKDIKVYLILDKIAEVEKLPVKEGDNVAAKTMEYLLKEANWEEAK